VSIRKIIPYAVAGIAIVAIAIGAYRFFGGGPEPQSNAPAAASKALPADEPKVPTSTQADKIQALVAQARQLANDGRFDEAERALDDADKVVKGQPEVAQARRDIAHLKTPEGQLALQLNRAKLAVDQGDAQAAEKALAEIEKLNPQAPEIPELRARLQQAKAKDEHRDDRITRHLAAMRDALAKKDFAGADSELNAAERIDVTDPAVRRARVELSRARNAGLKQN
jgi:hypothetical protein